MRIKLLLVFSSTILNDVVLMTYKFENTNHMKRIIHIRTHILMFSLNFEYGDKTERIYVYYSRANHVEQ